MLFYASVPFSLFFLLCILLVLCILLIKKKNSWLFTLDACDTSALEFTSDPASALTQVAPRKVFRFLAVWRGGGRRVGRAAAAAAGGRSTKVTAKRDEVSSSEPPHTTPRSSQGKGRRSRSTRKSSTEAKGSLTSEETGSSASPHSEVLHEAKGHEPAGLSVERISPKREKLLQQRAERMQQRDFSGANPVPSFLIELVTQHPSIRKMGMHERMDLACVKWDALSLEDRKKYVMNPLKGILPEADDL